MKAVKFEKGNKQKPTNCNFKGLFFYKPACLQKHSQGQVLSFRVFFSDGHYGLIVSPCG